MIINLTHILAGCCNPAVRWSQVKREEEQTPGRTEISIYIIYTSIYYTDRNNNNINIDSGTTINSTCPGKKREGGQFPDNVLSLLLWYDSQLRRERELRNSSRGGTGTRTQQEVKSSHFKPSKAKPNKEINKQKRSERRKERK